MWKNSMKYNRPNSGYNVLIMTVMVLSVPVITILSFFELISEWAYIFTAAMICLYFYWNLCPHCNHFARTGPKDLSYPFNAFGLTSPWKLRRCLNCDFKFSDENK